MSRESLAAIADRLREQGVIPADAPAPPDDIHERAWFIALMQGFAGWLAGVLLLVFIGTVFEPDSRLALLLLGAFLLAAAWTIYQVARDAVFLDQFALAISIAGQFAVVFGIVREGYSGLAIAVASLAVQVAVLFVMPNRAARTLAALFAGIAWTYTVRFLLRPDSLGGMLFGEGAPAVILGLGAWSLPLAWLLTWAPLAAFGIALIRWEPKWMSSGARELARPALTGLLLTLALGGVVSEPFVWLALGADAWGVPFSWSALFPLLSIVMSLLALYGAFRLRNPGLMGCAILGALLHLSRFYYFYGTTLLAKSAIMLCAGAALLLTGYRLRQRLSARSFA